MDMIEEKKHNLLFAWGVAIIITVSVFAVFVGQGLWSDVVTFQKDGDDLKQCFPGIIKAFMYIKNGFLGGVDTDSFNGATEFFSRSNMPNMYLPYIFTAIMAHYIPPRLAYLLLYAAHMIVCLAFTILLGKNCFGLDDKASIFVATSMATLAMYEAWYISHYFVVCLWAPCIYIGIDSAKKFKIRNIPLYAMLYILCFSSGYITTSVALAGLSFLFVFFYTYFCVYNKNLKECLIKTAMPFVVAVIFSFAYCFQLLLYVKNIVKNASSSIADTLYYQLSAFDLKRIITSSFFSVNYIEQISLISIGVAWCFLIALMIKQNVYKTLSKTWKIYFWFTVILNGVILLLGLGNKTPLSLWFYSFVPVFGSMHLPLRYLMISLPFLYILLAHLTNNIESTIGQKWMLIVAGLFFLLAVFFEVGNGYIASEIVDSESIIIECVLMSIFIYVLYRKGIKSWISILFCAFIILLPGYKFFFDYNQINKRNTYFQEKSIVYNADEAERLDSIVELICIPGKDRYTYAAFDSKESVPNFVPGNYGWYNMSEYNLDNYMGYELQLCLPSDYYKRFYWFNKMDWQYLIDTKADFIILDEESIATNIDDLLGIIDWDNSNILLDNNHRVLKFKSFVPSYLTGGERIVESNNVLNNGYFYSNELNQNDLLKFETNNATSFSTIIRAPKTATVSFLLYPNPNYKYFLNGEEIEPIVDNMIAYLNIPAGENHILITYESKLAKICNISFVIAYICAAISAVITIVIRLVKKRISKVKS